MARGRIRIGIGGWIYAPWRGEFYPTDLGQVRELEYASRRMTSIEINSTYYRSQKPETFARWHGETPEDFVFALKAPRYATNRQVLADSGASIDRFFASGVMVLKDKLGPINWQFLATKKFEPADFEAFLKLLPKSVEGRPIRHAVEVRHDSFACAAFAELARAHEVAIVQAGDSEYPCIAEATAPFAYARIMGTTEDAAQGYDDAALDRWGKQAIAWASGKAARDVFLYVISGYKQRNPAAAMALIHRTRRYR